MVDFAEQLALQHVRGATKVMVFSPLKVFAQICFSIESRRQCQIRRSSKLQSSDGYISTLHCHYLFFRCVLSGNANGQQLAVAQKH